MTKALLALVTVLTLGMSAALAGTNYSIGPGGTFSYHVDGSRLGNSPNQNGG